MNGLKPYPAYKDSGIEWLGEVPEGWSEEPLLALTRERKTSNTGMKEDNLLSLSYGRIVRRSIDSSDGLLPESFESYQIVEPDDIVLRLTDLQNDQRSLRSARVKERGIITSAYTAVRISGLYPAFSDYLFRAVDLHKVFYSLGGGVRQSMKYWDIKRIGVPLPPLREQKAIADFLDRETAEIDAFVQTSEQLIDLLNERRAAVITQAVTKGLDPNAPMKDSGIDGVDQIPLHWGEYRLSWLFDRTSSGTTPPAELIVDSADGNIPWVTSGELRESVVVSTSKSVSNGTISELSALSIHPAGSLLIAMYGATIGRMAILGVPATSNQAVCALYGANNAVPEFIQYALLGAKERLLLDAAGGGQPNINQDKVRAFRVPTPSLTEQEAIVAHLDRETARIDVAITEARKGIELAKERRQALISAAVTGKIDVRGAV